MSNLVAWKCPSGHVLGQVRRNGSKRQQMVLYRQAVNLSPNPSPKGEGEVVEVEVMAVVEGLVLDVRCSICGGIRTWRPGPRNPGLKSGDIEGETPSGLEREGDEP